MIKMITIGLCFLLIATIILGGVLLHDFVSLPSFSDAERRFQEDYQQLCVIQEYLTGMEESTVIVEADGKTMNADLNKIQIESDSVVAAISDLRKSGYTGINKFRDTIEFRFWEGNGSGCGIYYTSTGKPPSIQFVMETKPFSKENWHYYYSDYEEWRNS